jgi:hypothetical protein
MSAALRLRLQPGARRPFERGFERPFELGSNGFERPVFAHPLIPPYRSKGFEGPWGPEPSNGPWRGFARVRAAPMTDAPTLTVQSFLHGERLWRRIGERQHIRPDAIWLCGVRALRVRVIVLRR